MDNNSKSNKNRYIAIGWFSDRDENNNDSKHTKYILFDTKTFKVNTVSSDAIAMIHEMILNLTYSTYVEHLTEICKFEKYGLGLSKKIEVKSKTSSDSSNFYQPYTTVEISNIQYIVPCKRYVVTHAIIENDTGEEKGINPDDYLLYNGYILDISVDTSNMMKSGCVCTITLRYKTAYQVVQVNNNFSYKRGFMNINTNNYVNEQLGKLNNKLAMLGTENKEVKYIDNHGIWLVKTVIKRDKENNLPRCIDYIGFNMTNKILKELSSRENTKVVVTESQLNSMKYNVYVMAEETEYFGMFKQVKKELIIKQLENAINKRQIVIKDS